MLQRRVLQHRSSLRLTSSRPPVSLRDHDQYGGGEGPSIFYHDRIKRLDQSLDGATMLQLIGMDVRPMKYECLLQGYNKSMNVDTFEVPDDWTFYDDVVMRFLDEAWNEVVKKGLKVYDVDEVPWRDGRPIRSIDWSYDRC